MSCSHLPALPRCPIFKLFFFCLNEFDLTNLSLYQPYLDDQRVLLQALFRTHSFWWPWPTLNPCVTNYLFFDLTESETSTHALELGTLLESDNIPDVNQEWSDVVRKHLYRLIVERVPAQVKRPDTNKEVCVLCIYVCMCFILSLLTISQIIYLTARIFGM